MTGSTATLTGFNLGDDAGGVTFGTIAGDILSWSKDSITVTVPLGAEASQAIVQATTAAGDASTTLTINVMPCSPDCGAKVCGDNGCGGSCGSCAGNEVCDVDGMCTCLPDCAGLQCGDDGCGASCGGCFMVNAKFLGGNCICTPQCFDECGDNGCGDPCGFCGPNEFCDDGFCAALPGETCESPFTFTGPIDVADTLASASDDSQAPICAPPMATDGVGFGDHAYSVMLGAGTYTVTVTPAGFDAIVWVSGNVPCDVSATCVEGADTGGPGIPESVSITLPAAGTILVVVDGNVAGPPAGPYQLSVQPL